MHQVNPRFKPGGRKKLRYGLEAQAVYLLFLQVYWLYRIKGSYIAYQFYGAGGHPPPPPVSFLFYFFLNIQAVSFILRKSEIFVKIFYKVGCSNGLKPQTNHRF
jgi:hypothetical protein